MMSGQAIRALSDEMAAKAAEEGQEPLVPNTTHEGVDDDSLRRIPFLGDYEPPGWELVEEGFVDKSGFGTASEPAMTWRQFVDWVQQHLDTDPDTGFAITSEGQFQVYVGAYRLA